MKEIKNRRAFLQYVTKGILTGVLTFSSFKFGNSFELIPLGDQRDNQIPRINPAYRMNVLNDGTVELYTHTSIGVKVVHTFKGFEADILLTIIKERNPKLYTQELGLKYYLKEDDCISRIEFTLKSMENKGFIYYGELLLVKIKQAGND
jgi:hypothetical protein